MSDLEFGDIQGFVLSAYGRLASACYLCLSIEDAGLARGWLSELASDVRLAVDGAPKQASINLAFTYSGLHKLGLPFQTLKGFSREFQEGMAGCSSRSAVLGDTEGLWLERKYPCLEMRGFLYAPEFFNGFQALAHTLLQGMEGSLTRLFHRVPKGFFHPWVIERAVEFKVYF